MRTAIGAGLGFLVGGPIGAGIGAIAGTAEGFIEKGLPKLPKAPAALPIATRDDAVAQTQQADSLLRRRGGAADMVTGAYGAAPPTGTGKVTLGS